MNRKTQGKNLKAFLTNILGTSEAQEQRIHYRELKFFLHFLIPVRKTFALALILTFFSTGLNVLLPLSSKVLLDVFILQKGTAGLMEFLDAIGLSLLIPAIRTLFESMPLFMAAMVMLGLLTEALKVWQYTLLIQICQRVVFNIQTTLFERVLHLPLTFLKQQTVGSLMSRVCNDIQSLYGYLVHSDMLELVTGTLFLALSIGVLLWLNPILTLALLISIPIWALITQFFAIRLRVASYRSMEREAQVTQDMQEIFSGMEVIKAYLSERQEASKVSARLHLLFQTRLRLGLLLLLSNHLKKASKLVIILLMVWFGIQQIKQNSMTVGDVAAFMVYLAYFSSLSNKISICYLSFQHVFMALTRVRELFRVVPEHKDGEGNGIHLAPEEIQGEIRYHHVAFGYEEAQPVLEDASFTVRPGDIAALVGASGAGKTTLVNLLAKFNRPWSGAILLDGHDLQELDTRWLREQIGFVSQDIFLFNESVAYNIAYGNSSATLGDVIQAATQAHIHQEIEALPQGYQTVVGERGVKFSVGQRQRISIARAFLKNPKILIFDEPTSALDSETESRLKDSLKALAQERTIFMITHQMSLTDVANRVFRIHAGQIEEILQPTHTQDDR